MSTGHSAKYETYIQSPEWRAKANAAKQRAGFRCQVCNRPASQVQLDAHHRTYDRLGNELPEDITVLCHDCHKLFSENSSIHRDSESSSLLKQWLYWGTALVVGYLLWNNFQPGPYSGVMYILVVAPLTLVVGGLVLFLLQKIWELLNHKPNVAPLPVPAPLVPLTKETNQLSRPGNAIRKRPRTLEEVEVRLDEAMGEVKPEDIQRFRAKGFKPTLEDFYLIAAEDIMTTSIMYPQGMASATEAWTEFLTKAEQEEYAPKGK